MMKHFKKWLFWGTMVASLVMLFGCIPNSVIHIDIQDELLDFYDLETFELSDITIEIMHKDNTATYIPLSADMISESDLALLSTEGYHQITVNYQGRELNFNIRILNLTRYHQILRNIKDAPHVTITGYYDIDGQYIAQQMFEKSEDQFYGITYGLPEREIVYTKTNNTAQVFERVGGSASGWALIDEDLEEASEGLDMLFDALPNEITTEVFEFRDGKFYAKSEYIASFIPSWEEDDLSHAHYYIMFDDDKVELYTSKNQSQSDIIKVVYEVILEPIFDFSSFAQITYHDIQKLWETYVYDIHALWEDVMVNEIPIYQFQDEFILGFPVKTLRVQQSMAPYMIEVDPIHLHEVLNYLNGSFSNLEGLKYYPLGVSNVIVSDYMSMHYFMMDNIIKVDDVYYTKNYETLIRYMGNQTTYEVLAETKVIEMGAFAANQTLNRVILPEGLEQIKQAAFYGVSNLEFIHIPSTVKIIENLAFIDTTSLAFIYIPINVEVMGNFIFGFDNIKTIVFVEAESDLPQWESMWKMGVSNIHYGISAIESVTYSFETNGGTSVESITDLFIYEAPVTTKAGYYFHGWYNNSALAGSPVSFPYHSKDNPILYAKWGLEDLKLGIDFDSAIEIGLDVYEVTISQDRKQVYYKFVAPETGVYEIYSTGNKDTLATLANAQEDIIQMNDDHDDMNFKMTELLEAGETYYIIVQLYGFNDTGSFNLHVAFLEAYELSTIDEVLSLYSETMYQLWPDYQLNYSRTSRRNIQIGQSMHQAIYFGNQPVLIQATEETAQAVADQMNADYPYFDFKWREGYDYIVTSYYSLDIIFFGDTIIWEDDFAFHEHTLILYAGMDETVEIPAHITRINGFAFTDHPFMKYLIIGAHVLEIENNAIIFYQTRGLHIMVEHESKPIGFKEHWKLGHAGEVYWGFINEPLPYTFETYDGHPIEPVLAKFLTELPVPTHDTLYFHGWYDNPEFLGDRIRGFYIAAENRTLYAKWMNEPLQTGSTKEHALILNINEFRSVTFLESDPIYLRFTPTESGAYTFETYGYPSKYMTIMDDQGNLWKSHGYGTLSQTINLEAGSTYYIELVVEYFYDVTSITISVFKSS